MLFYFCLSSILSEINEIIHTKSLALYLSLVVQFSMTVHCPRTFPRQLDYYTTSLLPCQHFFEEKYAQITQIIFSVTLCILLQKTQKHTKQARKRQKTAAVLCQFCHIESEKKPSRKALHANTLRKHRTLPTKKNPAPCGAGKYFLVLKNQLPK